MEEIIQPVDRELLKKELTEEAFVRNTNNGNREIYIVSHHDSPHLMEEIGRLREISFREVGGGTGKEKDIDAYDVAQSAFKQLIVWDKEDEEIIGGYRYIEGDKIPKDDQGNLLSATSKLFWFSDEFVKDYIPVTIELGRSFIQPKYQPNFDIRKGLYSLDNLWDGLGSLVVDNKHIKYFFGKFTMYPSYDRYARDVIHRFLQIYFPDKDKLVRPFEPMAISHSIEEIDTLFSGDEYQKDYKVMVQTVRKNGENVPPLVNAYMNLSSTMKTFGTSLNPGFGNVEETAILISIPDIHDIKAKRHFSNYTKRSK
jgi:hypothetical protein